MAFKPDVATLDFVALALEGLGFPRASIVIAAMAKDVRAVVTPPQIVPAAPVSVKSLPSS
jgi:hypothetical protein